MLNKLRRLESRGRIGSLRGKAYERGTSKGRLEIYCNPRFKKRVSNQVPSAFTKTNKDRVSNPKFERLEV